MYAYAVTALVRSKAPLAPRKGSSLGRGLTNFERAGKLRARRLAAPEASAKTGALRRGVQRRETQRARSRRGSTALQRQGPERRGSRPAGPRGLASPENSVRLLRFRVDVCHQLCPDRTGSSRLSPGNSYLWN